MKFFLIAPLLGAGGADPAHPAQPGGRTPAGGRRRVSATGHDGARENSLRSRLDHHAGELDQHWREIDPVLLPDTAQQAAVDSAWIVQARGERFLTALVQLGPAHGRPGPHAPGAGHGAPVRTEQTEEFLSGVVQEIADATAASGTTALWVSRTLLLTGDETARPDWQDGEHTDIALSSHHAGGTPAQATASLGWGNNTIARWEQVDATTRHQIALGLVDAQAIWRELDGIALRSAAVVRHSLSLAGSAKRSVHQGLIDELADIATTTAGHNLAFDDLLLNVQGMRRSIARASLETWGYADLSARVARRLDETGAILEKRKLALDRRYQRLVSALGIGLSLAVFVDLILAFISTAYIGMPGSPAEGASWGIFRWFATTDGDALLLGSLALAGLATATIMLSRMHRDSRRTIR